MVNVKAICCCKWGTIQTEEYVSHIPMCYIHPSNLLNSEKLPICWSKWRHLRQRGKVVLDGREISPSDVLGHTHYPL
jgi:hypothetical protein